MNISIFNRCEILLSAVQHPIELQKEKEKKNKEQANLSRQTEQQQQREQLQQRQQLQRTRPAANQALMAINISFYIFWQKAQRAKRTRPIDGLISILIATFSRFHGSASVGNFLEPATRKERGGRTDKICSAIGRWRRWRRLRRWSNSAWPGAATGGLHPTVPTTDSWWAATAGKARFSHSSPTASTLPSPLLALFPFLCYESPT